MRLTVFDRFRVAYPYALVAASLVVAGLAHGLARVLLLLASIAATLCVHEACRRVVARLPDKRWRGT
jgi:hypothetical protein